MNLIVADPRERERPWLHYIRKLELNKAADFLKATRGRRLLEIGGGDGFVAHELSSLGFDVEHRPRSTFSLELSSPIRRSNKSSIRGREL